jgi:hypothetical protein
MKLIAQQDFSWAHRGIQVEHFAAGSEIETDDEDLITVSRSEGWAVEAGAAPPPTGPAGETPAGHAPAADGQNSSQTSAVPKRGRAAK